MNIFETVGFKKPKKTMFDLSHERKLSCAMGDLVPILCQEVVPGDKWNINSETFIRFAPMTAPVMHRINTYVHYFFVPNRIIWEDWEKWIVGEKQTVIPNLHLQGKTIVAGKLADHLGLPVGSFTCGETVISLPFRAYYKIWNDYYRDENLQTEADIEDLENDVDLLQGELLKRCWEKDYFTSALPWTQKGSPSHVDVHLGETALVHRTLAGQPTGTLYANPTVGVEAELMDATHNDIVDIASNDANIDVNEVRMALRIQRWLEKNARAGTRYAEFLLSHFGVLSKDSRLQRPEYLGGGKSPCVISEVLNTNGRADTDPDALPQGNMSGHGLSVGKTNQANYYCNEHGYILGIMSVMPVTGYSQGLPKMYSRSSIYDYYFPEFANLGEQEVKMKEIYMQDNDVNNAKTFGYQSRYAEYKYIPSTVHGDFKSSMDHWHMNRKFSAEPALNATFVEANPTTHIFAVENVKDNLWVQVWNSIQAQRPMPFLSVPSI